MTQPRDLSRDSPDGAVYRDLYFRVTTTLALSASFAVAAPQMLEIIGEAMRWDAGAVWIGDPASGRLRCHHFWHRRGDESIEPFREVSLKTDLMPGVSLPGRVQSSGEAVWVEDLDAESSLIRAGA